MAAKKDGTILGLRAKVWANLGAYLSTASTGIPTILHGLMLSGAYDIPNIHEDVYGVFTNTTPVDAYRGAGRPEATFIVERLVDLVAQKLKMDPVEIRKKNFIPPFTDGHPVATGLIYDSGNYIGALDKALEMPDYAGLRKKQAELRAKGEHVGDRILDVRRDLRPRALAGRGRRRLRRRALGERHRALPPLRQGQRHASASRPHGQGEETTFAQIVASELGVPVDDVEIFHGDTAQTPMGWGTYGSRVDAGRQRRPHGRDRQDQGEGQDRHGAPARGRGRGHRLRRRQVLREGLRRRSPRRSRTSRSWPTSPGTTRTGSSPDSRPRRSSIPPNFVYPFGAHIAVVRVDAETGEIRLERYIAVDDCGRVINPDDRRGPDPRRHRPGHRPGALGGRGLRRERPAPDRLDDGLRRAEGRRRSPIFELGMTETPTNVNPLGVKGIGETGTIASTPAVYNAVMDALAPLGVKKIDMPLTPERVWRAIRAAKPGT